VCRYLSLSAAAILPAGRPAAVTNDFVSATPSDEIDLRCWTADADAAAADDDSDNGSDVSHPACVLSTPRAVKCFITLSLSLTALFIARCCLALLEGLTI